MRHPFLGGTEVASPRLGGDDAVQRAGKCCSTQSRAFPTAGPGPTSPKESFSTVYVKVRFDP